jgi:hypothetical protein
MEKIEKSAELTANAQDLGGWAGAMAVVKL